MNSAHEEHVPLEDMQTSSPLHNTIASSSTEALLSDSEQIEEYKRGWQRAQADYQNLQKQISEQRKTWARMSEAQILEEFIPVYDNFKKAFAAKPTIEDSTFSQWSLGIGFIMQQFSEIFRRHDLKEMDVVGKVFDPTLHECVKEEEIPHTPAGTILREVSTGFLLDDTVFVPAKVVIAAEQNSTERGSETKSPETS